MMKDLPPPRDFVARHVSDLPRSGIRDFFEIVATRDDIISLGIGEPDFVTPQHIREAAAAALAKGATRYTSNLGLLELRQSVVRYLKRSYNGLEYDPKTETMITVGVSEGLDAAIRASVAPGDEVMYHEPCFVAYAPLIRLAHGVPIAVETSPENGFRLTRAALEAKVSPRTKVLLINFPCNPTGAALTAEDTAMLAEFVKEHDLLLITDKVYSELTYDLERVSVVNQPGMRERTVFLGGFSKAWAMTGFRLGFVCAPVDLLEAMMKVHQFGMMCAPTISQWAGIRALDEGWEDIAAMRESYRRRRDLMCAAFEEVGLDCFVPQGAFYAFPSIKNSGLTSFDFAMRFLEEEDVACVPGSAFGASGEGFVRCAYATDIDEIKEAMRRLGAFVKRLRHG